MTKLRITIITGPLLPVPAIQGGSVARMWDGLASEFAAAGHDVLIMARSFPGQPAEEIRNGVRFKRHGGFAQTRSTAANVLKDLVYAFGVLPRLPDADILVTNDFWLPILAGVLRTKAGKIVVSANRFPKGQYRFYGRAARIIAASQVIAKTIAAQAPSLAERVRTIPNPLDSEVFAPPKDGRPNRTTKTILYVGRVHPEKGIHLLVSAFREIVKRNSGVNLRIVGPTAVHQGGGGEAYVRELRELSKDLPVSFAPPEFDTTRLSRIYQEADLFCYPSIAEKGEALPVAPLEAMATGLPVVVSGLECFSDFIVNRHNGLSFDHRSRDPAGTLAQAFDETLSNWEHTRELGKKAIGTAQSFSFANVAKTFLSEFEACLKR